MTYISKDAVLPYMADANHCPDTLFLIAESDFRFYSADGATKFGEEEEATASAFEHGRPMTQESLSPAAMSPAAFSGEGRAASVHVVQHRTSVPGTVSPACSSRHNVYAAPESLTGASMLRPSKRPRVPPCSRVVWCLEESHASRTLPARTKELRDLIHTCTMAHRHNVGQVVCLSWCAGVWEQSRELRDGSSAPHCSLIAVSHRGAVGLLRLLESRLQGHWDDVLLSCLCQSGNRCKLVMYGSPSVWSRRLRPAPVAGPTEVGLVSRG